MINVEPSDLHEYFLYSPDDGELVWRARPRAHFATERLWKRWNTRYSGKPVRPKPDRYGYRIVRLTINGEQNETRIHRVIFAMQTGAWPAADVDHTNRIRADNRWANLRPATRAENNQNKLQHSNASGLPGVWWCERQGKWRARLQADRRRKHLGSFMTAAEAHASYLAAKAQMHPFSLEALSG